MLQHVTELDSSFRGQVNNSQRGHETQWNKPSDKLKCHWDTQAHNPLVRLVGYSWIIPSWCTRGSLRRQGASLAPELEPGADAGQRSPPPEDKVMAHCTLTMKNQQPGRNRREESGHGCEATRAEGSGHGSQDTRLTFQVYSSLWKCQDTFRNSKQNCFKTSF